MEQRPKRFLAASAISIVAKCVGSCCPVAGTPARRCATQGRAGAALSKKALAVAPVARYEFCATHRTSLVAVLPMVTVHLRLTEQISACPQIRKAAFET